MRNVENMDLCDQDMVTVEDTVSVTQPSIAWNIQLKLFHKAEVKMDERFHISNCSYSY